MPHDTEPYEQLFSEEESKELARQSSEKHQRHKKRRYKHRPPNTREQGPQGPAVDFAEDPSDASQREDSSMSLFTFLIPPLNPRPETIRRYRIAVSISITVCFILLAAGWGVFERFGWAGFARADVIKSKIEESTQPLTEKINAQIILFGKLSGQVTEQLASATASEIRAKIAKRCFESPNSVERERLNNEIWRLQQQYLSYKPAYYPEPQCSEL